MKSDEIEAEKKKTETKKDRASITGMFSENEKM